ncbi:MAG: GNAT family N-acetyltransferase, partial [Candidatus Binatia bacterium]
MEIRIRRVRRTDFETLCALGAWPGVDGSLRRSIRLFRNTIADLAYDLYVAEEGGEAVGVVTVSYVRVLGLGGQRATLEELVVRPDRRGAGIGR